MARAYASTIVSAPIEDVWTLVRDFDGLPSWHPLIADSAIEDGRTADSVGCVRRLGLTDGSAVRERLLQLDDIAHRYTYNFVESPFPVRSYHCTIELLPVTESSQTFAAWWADFDADAADEPDLLDGFTENVFATGLRALAAHFG